VRDVADDRLEVKLRESWWSRFGGAESPDIWSGLAADIRQQATQMGAKKYLDWFEATPSHVLQIGVRRNVYFRDSSAALERLYKIEVERAAAISSDSLSIPRRQSSRLQLIRLSGQKAVSHAVSFIPGKFNRQHRIQYVLLTSLLAGVIFAGRANHPTVATPRLKVTALGFPPLDHRSMFTLNLPSAGSLEDDVSSHYTARVRRSHRKTFVPQRVRFRAPTSSAPTLDPPPLFSSKVTGIATTSPLSVLPSLPRPPRYRSRNKLINILSKLATPFKGKLHEQTTMDLPQAKSRGGSSAFTNHVRSR
jgi:hypothetical protein